MNASVYPDPLTPDRNFRDSLILEDALVKLRKLVNLSHDSGRPFVMSVGFKLPHTQYHIPKHFFDMYINNFAFLNKVASVTDNILSFPDIAPLMNYRCCVDNFRPLRALATGKRPPGYNMRGAMRSGPLIYKELLSGYLSSVSFVDFQVAVKIRLRTIDISCHLILVLAHAYDFYSLC